MTNMQIPLEAMGQLGTVAQHGSPLLVNSLGRLFGLGQEEQKALVKGEFPRWAVFAIGLGAGVVAGIMVQRKFPSQVSKVLGS